MPELLKPGPSLRGPGYTLNCSCSPLPIDYAVVGERLRCEYCIKQSEANRFHGKCGVFK
jgi:hypothetical protein